MKQHWEAEAAHWEAEIRRSAQELQYWENEMRLKACDLQTLAEEVRLRTAEYQERVSQTRELEERIEELREAARKLGDFSEVLYLKPSLVPERAAAYLKGVLDSVPHGPGWALRLIAESEEEVRLAPDLAREGDKVVSHDGNPVLLVGTALAGSLIGKTLDISEARRTWGGRQRSTWMGPPSSSGPRETAIS